MIFHIMRGFADGLDGLEVASINIRRDQDRRYEVMVSIREPRGRLSNSVMMSSQLLSQAIDPIGVIREHAAHMRRQFEQELHAGDS